MVHQLQLIAVACTLAAVQAFPRYVRDVPNGEEEFGGDPIGHSAGAPRRDDFARDLDDAGIDWQAVCSLDSDGDGRTNGEELGDPNCIWTKGDTPEFSIQSNPGVADAVGDLGSSSGGLEIGLILVGAVFVLVGSVGLVVKRRNAQQQVLALTAANNAQTPKTQVV